MRISTLLPGWWVKTLVGAALLVSLVSGPAQGTAFTYQGTLNTDSGPANGLYDLRFALFDDGLTGAQQGSALTNLATVVSNGLFTAPLDFGNQFPGAARWLEIAARTNNGGAFTTLAPRQALTAAPYAVTASGVPAGAVTSTMLATGAVTSDKIATGAVKASAIDDGGEAAYTTFQTAAQSLGGDTSLGFSTLAQIVPTNAITPALTFTINGGLVGTVIGFSGFEAMSQAYSFVVQVRYSGRALDPEAELGTTGRLSLTRNGRTTAYCGVITACTQAASTGTGQLYTFRLESRLAYLALNRDYHAYQNLAVPAVVAGQYTGAGGATPVQSLALTYPVTANIIQYNETGLNFCSRQLEREGIFYFFDQSASPPGLILGDSPAAYLASPNSPFPYYGDSATSIPAGTEFIRLFHSAARQSTLQTVVDTYNYTTPAVSLQATETGTTGVGQQFEFGNAVGTAAYDKQLAQARQGRQAVEHDKILGASVVPDLRAGYTFVVSDQTSLGLSGTYLATAVHHAAFVRVTNGVSTVFYGNQFEAIPAALTYRPALVTPKPLAQPCVAVVTGPTGEEIYADSRGRIKVLFKWDRYDANDQTSSAWLRLATPTASANGRGILFLPRVGDEVLVSFLYGDPDQPVVTGSLYNGVNTPPYALPANQTVSTIRSTGSKAQPAAINEIMFDDKASAQVMNLRAARDLNLTAASNCTVTAAGKISVGPLGNLQAGQAVVGYSTTAATNVSITFPKTFTTTPKVVATVNADPGWNVNDTFIVSVRTVSTTGCVLNVLRADAATGWSQSLRVNWLAWE